MRLSGREMRLRTILRGASFRLLTVSLPRPLACLRQDAVHNWMSTCEAAGLGS
jgi:hypothetical protein